MPGLSTVERLLLWIGGTILLRGVVIALNPGILDFWAFDFEAYWLAAQRLVDPIDRIGEEGACALGIRIRPEEAREFVARHGTGRSTPKHCQQSETVTLNRAPGQRATHHVRERRGGGRRR